MTGIARTSRPIVFAAACVALAGCGGGDEPPASDPPGAAPPPEATAETAPAERPPETPPPPPEPEVVEPPAWAETYEALAARPVADLSADGAYAAVPSPRAGEVDVYDGASGELVREQLGQPPVVRTLAFGPAGRVGASGGFDGRVVVWRTGSREAGLDRFAGRRAVDATLFERPYGGPRGPVTALAWGPGSDDSGGRPRRLVAGYEDGTAVVWAYPIPDAIPLFARDSAVKLLVSDTRNGLVAAAFADGITTVFDLSTGRVRAEIAPGPTPVSAMAFDPTGRTLGIGRVAGGVQLHATADGRQLTGGRPHRTKVIGLALGEGGYAAVSISTAGDLRFWDPRAAPAGDAVALPSAAVAVTRSADGAVIVGRDGSLSLGGSSRVTALGEAGTSVTTAAGTANGTLTAVGYEDGRVARVDTRSRRTLGEAGRLDRLVEAVAVDAAGERIVAADEAGEVRVFDAASGAPEGRVVVPAAGGSAVSTVVAVTRDGGRFAAAGGGTLTIGPTAAGGPTPVAVDVGAAPPVAIAFDAVGRAAVTAFADGRVTEHDAASGALDRDRTIGRPITAAAIDTGADRLAVVAEDGAVRVFDLASLSPLAEIDPRGGAPAVAVAIDAADRVTVATADGRLGRHPVATKRFVRAHESKAVGFAAAAGLSGFVTADAKGNVRFWRADGSGAGEADAVGGADRLLLAGPRLRDGAYTVARRGGVASFVKSTRAGSGEESAAGGFLGDVAVLEGGRIVASTGHRLRSFLGRDWRPVGGFGLGAEIAALAPGPTPRSAVVGFADGRVVLQETAAEVALTLGEEPVTAARFAPDGGVCVLGDVTGRVALLDVATGEVARRLEGHEAAITDVSFTPDGEVLATACYDGEVRLWAAKKLRLDGGTSRTRTVLEHEAPVHRVSAGPRERTLLTAADDGVRLWDVAEQAVSARFDEGTASLDVAPASDGTIAAVTAGPRLRRYGPVAGEGESPARTVASLGAPGIDAAGGGAENGGADGSATAGTPTPAATRPAAPTDDSERNRLRGLEAYRVAKTAAARAAIRRRLPEPSGDSFAAETSPLPDVAVDAPPEWDGPTDPLVAAGRRVVRIDSAGVTRDGVVLLAVSADGNLVAAARPDAPATVGLWDVGLGTLRFWDDAGIGGAADIDFVADGRLLVTRPVVAVFDGATGRSRALRDYAQVLLSPGGSDGAFLLGERGEPLQTRPIVTAVDPLTGESIPPTLEAYETDATALEATPDGKLLFAALRDRDSHRVARLEPGTLRQLSAFAKTDHVKPRQDGGTAGVTAIRVAPDGGHMVVASHDDAETYRLRSFILTDSGEARRTADFKNGSPICLRGGRDWARFVGDGSYFITETERGFAVADAATGRPRHLIEDADFADPAVVEALSDDGRWLAAGTPAGEIKLWRTDPPLGPFRFRAHVAAVVGLRFAADGTTLVSCGAENEIHVRDLSGLFTAIGGDP